MKSIITETTKLPSTHLVKKTWSELVNKTDGNPTDRDHLYYIILRAVVAKYPDSPQIVALRVKRAFPPVTNTKKINLGGRRPFDTLKRLTNVTWYSYFNEPRLGVSLETHIEVLKLMARVHNYV